MKRWKRYCRIGILSMLLIPAFSTFIAYAAPIISIQQGNPPEKTKPPCAVYFSVSDPAGVVSIVVNGRELGPNGGDYYEADYTTYYNGTVTISAVNRNGETSTEVVQITNLATAIEQSEVPAPAQTQAPPQTEAPTQVQPQTTAPHQTEAPTQAQTTQATLPVETSETETSEEETAAEESSAVEESSQETQEESANKETVNDTSEAEIEEVSQAPELPPPDSYKLYPGGRKNMIVPTILISACICAIGYMIVTLILNRKRLEKYKQLHDVLVKRQDMISQRDYEKMKEDTIDGLPDDDYEEDGNEK